MSEPVPSSESTFIVSSGGAPIPYADPTTPRGPVAPDAGITRGDVAALAVRIVGIYVMFQGLPIIAVALQYGFDIRSAMPEGFIFLIFEAIGVGIVWKAPLIGRWLLPGATMPSDLSAIGSPAAELQTVAFSVIGVVMVAQAAPELAFVFWRNTYASIQSHSRDTGSDLLLNLCRPVVQIGIGLGLFFGSKRLSRYWRHLRAEPSAHDEQGPL